MNWDEAHLLGDLEAQEERRMTDDLVKRLREGDHFEKVMSAEQAADRIEELEAKLAKAVADMKALTAVSTLMQLSASHDRFKHNTIVTDSIWSQWSRQLKFVRTTLAELTGGKKDDR